MDVRQQAKIYIESSTPALKHLYDALSEYNKVLESAQTTAEEIDKSEQVLADLFTYRDQWSPNANLHHAQYIARLIELEKQAKLSDAEKLEKAIADIGTSVESMAILACAVLQVAKQSLSIRFAGKPDIAEIKQIGSQSIIEVIWEGRNHSMHWDDPAPRQDIQNMLNALASDFGINFEPGKNNSMSILRALEWNSPENVVSDIKNLVQ